MMEYPISNMFCAKTGVETHINEIESHAHLTHYHGHALHLVVGETIKAIKIIRGILDAAFELNKLQIPSKRAKSFQKASIRLREETAPRNSGDRALLSNRWMVRGTLLQSI